MPDQTAFLIAKIAKLETTSGNIIWMDQTDGSETAVGNTIKFRSKSHKNNACLPVFISKNRKIKKKNSLETEGTHHKCLSLVHMHILANACILMYERTRACECFDVYGRFITLFKKCEKLKTKGGMSAKE